MNRFRWSAVLAAALATGMPGAHAESQYVASEFRLAGSQNTLVGGFNGRGQFAANSWSPVWGSLAYIYDAGALTTIAPPTSTSSVFPTGLSDDGIVIGHVNEPTYQRPFVWADGEYLPIDFAGLGFNAPSLRAISPDGRYIVGSDVDAAWRRSAFVYDVVAQSVVARIETPGGDAALTGVNKHGQAVGVGYDAASGGSKSLVYDIVSGERRLFAPEGVYFSGAVDINSQGDIVGYGKRVDDLHAPSIVWILSAGGVLRTFEPASGYMTPMAIDDMGRLLAGARRTTGGYVRSMVVTDAEMPVVAADGPFLYRFSAPVQADTPLFIDPLVAEGYAYRVGAGDPLFRSVSLPMVGDTVYTLVVGGQRFELAGYQVFDFTEHGFVDGVRAFRVEDIEGIAQLDPRDPTAFVTQLGFMDDGMFTGTQRALPRLYEVPEPAPAALMLAGLAGLGGLRAAGRRRRRVA